MDAHTPYLQWIQTQQDRMVELVSAWSSINTFSRNLPGLRELATKHLRPAFESLGAHVHQLPLAAQQVVDAKGHLSPVGLGEALHLRKTRPAAKRRVLLAIHMDTVYPPAQHCAPQRADAATLRGPGVCDAKGGLAVLLIALEALERSPYAGAVQWEVLLNPDEELGSPGSGSLLAQLAHQNDIGLVYEPATEDGALVSQRKGSGNFTAVVRGRSAHAGRDFERGRNAIDAVAQFITRISTLSEPLSAGVTVNVGHVEGGTALNVVPDLAICRFNVRVKTPQQQELFQHDLSLVLEEIGRKDGISIDLHGGFHCPPKLLDAPTARLLEHLQQCGQEIGVPITWKPSGGVCDGNRLAAAGLPTVDSLGVRGGSIHSPDEYLLVDSLTERAKLSALLLMKLAAGEIV